MALQDSDLLYLERGGVIYQTNWGAIRTRTVAATDLALIERGGTHYKVAIGDFWDCTVASQVGDNFLIERAAVLYHEEILFPCSVRINVSGATTTTVLVSGTPINGIPATILQPDGTEVVITATPTLVTLTQDGTYEFSGNISEFKIQGSDGLVDASLDPATKWSTVFSGVSDFGNGTFTNIAALSGLPANLPVSTLDGTFEGTSITATNISSLDTSIVTSAVGTFKDSGISAASDITSWNVTNVTNMSRMFENAVNFTNDISTWDISNVTDMSSLFKDATLFNADLSIWASDVVGVTNMSNMFANNVLFNQDLSLWDTSTVKDMAHMFDTTGSFNQDLGAWDVSLVSNMDSMFSAAGQFDQDITEWCVSLIPTEPAAFSTGTPLQTVNKPNWGQCSNTSQIHYYKDTFNSLGLRVQGTATAAGVVKNPDGTTISIGPGNFDIKLGAGNNYGYYEMPMEIITKMTFGSSSSHQNQRSEFTFEPGFYTGALTTTSGMFRTCSKFNGRVSDWDMSNVTDMSRMFSGAGDFNGDVSNWDVSKVVSTVSMFDAATDFDQPLNDWDVSNVTRMESMFQNARSFNQPLDQWVTSGVTNMAGMFAGTDVFNQDLNAWDTSKVTNMSFMFRDTDNFTSDLDSWDMSNVRNIHGMFISAFVFNGDVSTWDVSKATTLSYVFDNAKLFNSDISGWDTSNKTNFLATFRNATAFNQPLGGWDTSNVVGLNSTFENAANFIQDLTPWCVGSHPSLPNLFDSGSGFEGQTAIQPQWGTCPFPGSGTFTLISLATPGKNSAPLRVELTYLGGGSQDITYPNGSTVSWNSGTKYSLTDLGDYEFPMGVVTRMEFFGLGSSSSYQEFDFAPDFYTGLLNTAANMFSCMQAFNGDVSNWDMSGVTNMSKMFFNAFAFNRDISNWDVGNVTNMAQTFRNAKVFDTDISGWNTSKVRSMNAMFFDAYVYNQPMANWDVSKVTNMADMFRNTDEFNQYLAPWETQKVTTVNQMFRYAAKFNQDISNWCMPLVSTIDTQFSANSGFRNNPEKWPVAGVCNSYNGIYLEELVGGGDLVLGGVASAPTTIRRPDGTLINVTAGSFANKETQLGWYEFQGIENYEGVRFFDNDLLFDDTSETARFRLHPTFDTSNMTQLRQMFRECHLFNGDVSMLDTSNAVNMAAMFRNARVFNQDLSHFDTANATNMANMFHDAFAFNQDISQWRTDQVFDMENTFNDATVFNQDLSGWCVPLISAKPGNFDPNSGFDGVTARQPGWGGCPGSFVIATPPVIASFSTVVPAPYGDSLIIQTEATTTPSLPDIVKVSQIWQQSTDGGTTWTDIVGPETGDTFVINGYVKGALIRLVETWDNTVAPSTPQVTESNTIEIVDTIAPPSVFTGANTVNNTMVPTSTPTYGYYKGSLYGPKGFLVGIPMDAFYTTMYDPINDTNTRKSTRSDLRGQLSMRGGAGTANGQYHMWAADARRYSGQWRTQYDSAAALDHGDTNTGKFFGAVYSPTENVTYYVPYGNGSIEFYDFDASFSNRGPNEISPPVGSLSFCGGILGPDGNIYFFPNNSRTFLKLEIPTKVWTTWTPADWTSPLLGSAQITAGGCVVGQKVYISPGFGTDILKMHFDDLDGAGYPKVTSIDVNAASGQSLGGTEHNYNRPILMDGGILVIIPSKENRKIIYVDTADDSITSFANPISINASRNSTYGAILLPNGDIVSTPENFNKYVTYRTFLNPPAGYDPLDPNINPVP